MSVVLRLDWNRGRMMLKSKWSYTTTAYDDTGVVGQWEGRKSQIKQIIKARGLDDIALLRVQTRVPRLWWSVLRRVWKWIKRNDNATS